MKINIKKNNFNFNDLMRKAGYFPFAGNAFVRELGALRYPRFHIYIKEKELEIEINLHLDQKKPSYQGSNAHSGEYDGKLVEQEAERLKQFFENYA